MPVASGPLTRSRASFLGLVAELLGGTSLDTCLAPESDPVMICSAGLLPCPDHEQVLLLLLGDFEEKAALWDDRSCTHNDRLPCRLNASNTTIMCVVCGGTNAFKRNDCAALLAN